MSLTVVSRPELAVGAQFSRLVSAIQAILYQFQREDFAVFEVNSDGGDARFLITGDFTSEILVGDSIYSGVSGYIGTDIVQTVLFSVGNTEVTMTTFAFVATGTGFMNDFTARPNYFVDFIIRTIGRDGASDVDLVVNPRIEPFSDGTLVFDVSPYLSSELDPDPVPDLTDISDFFTKRDVRFFIKYRENWTGSAESQTLDSSFEFNALIAVKQIGEENTMNLVEYVPFGDENGVAKWLTDLDQCRFFPGYEFYMMFYYPETSILGGTIQRLEIQLDENGQFVSESRLSLASKPEGVNYMKLAEGYEETTKFVDVAIINSAPNSSLVVGDQGNDIFFLPESSIGWVGGQTGKVHKTTDDGEIWTEIIDLGTAQITRIRFVDPDNGFLTDQTLVRKSIDGGASWSDISPVASVVYEALFVWSKDRLIVCSSGGSDNPFISNDAGTTWTEQNKIGASLIVRGFFFWDLNKGIMIGTGGSRVQYTEDGGTTWIEATGTVAATFNDVHGYANGVAIGVGLGSIIRSTDFGKTWTEVDTDVGLKEKIAPTSNDNVLYATRVVSDSMMVSYDNGQSWEIETIGSIQTPIGGGAVHKGHLHLATSTSFIMHIVHIVFDFKRIKIIHEDCPSPFYIRFNNLRGGNTWWMFTLNQSFTTDDSKEEVLLEDDQLNDNEYEVLVQLNTPNDITDLSVRDLDGVKKLQEQGMIAVNQVDKDGNETGLVVLEQAQVKSSNSSIHQIDIIVQKPEKQRLL